MLEVRISNASATPRILPVSQDGAKLVGQCPDHTVLQATLFLGSKGDNKYFRQLGLFYGCEAFPATVLQLKPGEWVSYVTNISTISTARLPKEIRAQIRFTHTRYQQGAGGTTSEDMGYDTSEFSPWVPLPKAPDANE
jgi:hypothetical protein